MTRDALRSTIAEILGEILDRDCLLLSEAATAADVEGWDSLTNLKLFVALERACGVKFQLGEMNEAENVGQLVDLILVRRGG